MFNKKITDNIKDIIEQPMCSPIPFSSKEEGEALLKKLEANIDSKKYHIKLFGEEAIGKIYILSKDEKFLGIEKIVLQLNPFSEDKTEIQKIKTHNLFKKDDNENKKRELLVFYLFNKYNDKFIQYLKKQYNIYGIFQKDIEKAIDIIEHINLKYYSSPFKKQSAIKERLKNSQNEINFEDLCQLYLSKRNSILDKGLDEKEFNINFRENHLSSDTEYFYLVESKDKKIKIATFKENKGSESNRFSYKSLNIIFRFREINNIKYIDKCFDNPFISSIRISNKKIQIFGNPLCLNLIGNNCNNIKTESLQKSQLDERGIKTINVIEKNKKLTAKDKALLSTFPFLFRDEFYQFMDENLISNEELSVSHIDLLFLNKINENLNLEIYYNKSLELINFINKEKVSSKWFVDLPDNCLDWRFN